MRAALLGALAPVAIGLAPAAAQAATVIVQGTTDVRDSGLLADVIVPGFAAAYPGITLKYVAVGSGEALTNARAGQADVVLTHSPPDEARFVADGYSADGQGAAVFYSDYVLVGPASDPAGVRRLARHDAAKAFSLIAAAGSRGVVDFVSRGDDSGTNVEEKGIWALSGVARDAQSEPGSGQSDVPGWYHRAGVGQAASLQLADQCPFASGACYAITDRGTYEHLEGNGSIPRLTILAERNSADAKGGATLLVNSFHAYVVNSAKVPTADETTARAFIAYLTSPAFQARVSAYPTRSAPSFFPDARPRVALTRRLPGHARRGMAVRLAGSVAPLLPGARSLAGTRVYLLRLEAARAVRVETARAGGGGRFRFVLRARAGRYRIVVPAVRDLQAVALDLGRLRVTAR